MVSALHIPHQLLVVVRSRFSWGCLLVSSPVTWRKKINSSMHSRNSWVANALLCCPFNRYQGDWKPSWAPGPVKVRLLCLFVEGFIHLVFLVRWPVADPQAVMSPITALPLILSPKLSVGPYLSLGGRVWADCKKYDTHLDLLHWSSLSFGLLLNLGNKRGSALGELDQFLPTWLLSSEVTQIFPEVCARQQMKTTSLYGVSILCGHSLA